MYDYASSVHNSDIINIVAKTFNCVDSRLIGHGTRVACMVSNMLVKTGDYTLQEQRDICILAMLHDIGAYKTEDINDMVIFETETAWNHSIYGYLFLKYFSPYTKLAPSILFHHAQWSILQDMKELDDTCKKLAQIFCIADRADIFFGNPNHNKNLFYDYLKQNRGTRYSPEAVDLFLKTEIELPLILNPLTEHNFYHMMNLIPFTKTEIDAFLKMIIFSIDFRSKYTVTHTITTASISHALAKLLGLTDSEINDITCGAMLHDLGKIGIPSHILEFPGKLSAEDMDIMKTHVDITEHIIENSVTSVIRQIALRHHEKLDGSGYPRGLHGEVLTVGERIVAVADIVSALWGIRSYKAAFPKEKIISIINEMAVQNMVDQNMVSIIIEHFDGIMIQVTNECTPILTIYNGVQQEYILLLNKLSAI